MDMHLETPREHFFVRSMDENGIRINDDYFTRSFVLSARLIEPDWPVATIDDINEDSLKLVFDMQPELVLIGCGKQQKFLRPEIQMLFLKRGIGVEIMITDAACRTFNVLVAEGRGVVAALLVN